LAALEVGMSSNTETHSPSISVLLAVYNGGRYLPALLDSLLAQEFPPCEILACDDGSTDDSLAILRAYAQRSSVPIRIHQNAQNLGYRDNFWHGIPLCEGRYIAFCDQDDVWLPEKLRKMSEAIIQHHQPHFLFSDCALVDASLRPLGIAGLSYSGISPEKKGLIHSSRLAEVLIERPCITGMTMVVRKDLLLQLPRPVSDIPHDYLISAALSLGKNYVFLDEPLVLYRQHDANVIGMSGKKKPRKRQGFACWTLEILSRDVIHKQDLIRYLLDVQRILRIHPCEFDVLLERSRQFFDHRLHRRQHLLSLLRPMPMPLIFSTKKDTARRMWLKDVRVYCRLKFSKLFRKFSPV
jgi:glycosyltransferase involved in cell wall biosynthesis